MSEPIVINSFKRDKCIICGKNKAGRKKCYNMQCPLVTMNKEMVSRLYKYLENPKIKTLVHYIGYNKAKMMYHLKNDNERMVFYYKGKMIGCQIALRVLLSEDSNLKIGICDTKEKNGSTKP